MILLLWPMFFKDFHVFVFVFFGTFRLKKPSKKRPKIHRKSWKNSNFERLVFEDRFFLVLGWILALFVQFGTPK